MNMDDARQTFIIECRELLQQMEVALLRIEQEPDDADTINAIFRAAHTIKGSSGLFGFQHLVEFTHAAESVLDQVRSGGVPIDADLVSILLSVCDHLGLLVEFIASDEEPADTVHSACRTLVSRLQVYLESAKAGGQPQHINFTQEDDSLVEREVSDVCEQAATDNWHLSLRFNDDIFRNGMDPLAILHYLGTVGRIMMIVTLTDKLPSAIEMDPESNYLGFEIAYQSDADKATIDGVFDFVRENSQIRLLPPHSKMTEYLSLIQSMPEDDMKLGEILVKCGTLTLLELETTLTYLRCEDETGQSLEVALVEQQIVRMPVVQTALVKQNQIKENKNKGA